MVSDKLIEEAMNSRYDGINAYDIAQEVLELEAQLKTKDEEIKRLSRIIELDEQIEKSWKAGTQPPAKS